MALSVDGTELKLARSDGALTARWTPAERGPGSVALRLDNHLTRHSVENVIQLDPWSPEGYAVFEWDAGGSLIIGGGEQIVIVECESLQLCAAVCLEYEEGETIDRPWFAESEDGRFLVVATEMNVWCLDGRRAIRWTWGVRTREPWHIIVGPLKINRGAVEVPVRSARGDETVLLQIADGIEVRP